VAVYLDDVEGAQRFAELLRDQRYSDNVRGLAYRLLARVAAAKGQWSVAQAQLDTARQFDATAALELRSLLAVLPFLHVPRAELLAIRREVEAWRARPEGPGETSHSTAHAGLHPYMRLYRLGLLSAQLGDTAAALQQAGALDDSSDSYEDERSVALGTFAHSIRARVATAGGRPAEALEHLDAANWELVESRFETEALDRYNRAELLYALGRPAEALGWYRSIAERATYEMVYVAPARWRQGEIHERAGDREKAGEAYADVMRLWRHADPRLQATVADAERRLHTIGGSSAAAGPARAAQGAHMPEVPGR
jgi:tetratricopeptide (TPR) repeat protein